MTNPRSDALFTTARGPIAVEFLGGEFSFTPWRALEAPPFVRTFAFDVETDAIDREHHWLVPPYVIGAAFDGSRGYFVARDDLPGFWGAHAAVPTVFHNAAFDLGVLDMLVAPGSDVYAKVDRRQVWDTWLLHRLYVLATDGHTAAHSGESTLEHCTAHYLGDSLTKDGVDVGGKPIRTAFGQYLNQPPQTIPRAFLEYLARDAVATWFLHEELQRRITACLAAASDAWGYVSEEWLAQCRDHWGPLTHHVQLQASIVLKSATRNGLWIDSARRDRLLPDLCEDRDRLFEQLRRDHGVIAKGPGSQKVLQTKFGKLAAAHPESPFPKTETGLFATSADVLADLAPHVPFVDDLLKYRAVERLVEFFHNRLSRSVIRPSFQVLARTGRTTSFGELNAQNLPRDDRVRNCFVPSPGHRFLDLDYATIELVALAQACRTQFGWASGMAERINAGADLHRVFAAHVTGKEPGAVTEAERDRVKAINFGKPGGMGNRTLQAYAKSTYGITLTEDEVRSLSDRWVDLFPEMTEFLKDTIDVPLALARRLDLTPHSHARHTGDDRFVRYRGSEDDPNWFLGAMCLKVLGHEEPRLKSGSPYRTDDLDYFWTRLQDLRSDLPEKLAAKLATRSPSPQLQRAVTHLVNRTGVFTLTGRLRADASFTARHNTIFQGLASDGANLALWWIWRAGYRIVNFIHDQILVEIPDTEDQDAAARRVEQLMIDAMCEVIPDVRVKVKSTRSDRWQK